MADFRLTSILQCKMNRSVVMRRNKIPVSEKLQIRCLNVFSNVLGWIRANFNHNVHCSPMDWAPRMRACSFRLCYVATLLSIPHWRVSLGSVHKLRRAFFAHFDPPSPVRLRHALRGRRKKRRKKLKFFSLASLAKIINTKTFRPTLVTHSTSFLRSEAMKPSKGCKDQGANFLRLSKDFAFSQKIQGTVKPTAATRTPCVPF